MRSALGNAFRKSRRGRHGGKIAVGRGENFSGGDVMGDGSRRTFDGSQAPWRDSHFAEVSRVLARVISFRDDGRACTRARIRDVPSRLQRAFHSLFARVFLAIYLGAAATAATAMTTTTTKMTMTTTAVNGDDERRRSARKSTQTRRPVTRWDKRDTRAYQYYANHPSGEITTKLSQLTAESDLWLLPSRGRATDVSWPTVVFKMKSSAKNLRAKKEPRRSSRERKNSKRMNVSTWYLWILLSNISM